MNGKNQDAIKQYRKRRQERIDKRNGVVRKPRYDSVEEYRKRREKRLEARADAGVGWVYGILQQNGIDTKGMDVKEAFEELAKLNGGKGGKGGKDEKGGKGGKSGESKNGSGSKSGGIKKSSSENDRRGQECDGSGYKGKAGEVKTGIGGKLAPKSDAAKRIDVSDALSETKLYKESGGKKGIEKNSLSDYIDKDGNLTPERQKVHDEIVQKVFANLKSYDGKATMIMSGGGPASGKSFVSDGAKEEFGKETVCVVDPDALKAMLPGYADMAVKDEKAAGFYHEESSALAKRIYQFATDNNINVVYDGTGDGSVNSVKKKLKMAQDAGYAVKGEYVTVDVNGESGALVRNKNRYEHAKKKWDEGAAIDPPRLVGDDHVKGIHAAVSDIAPDVANLFDEWKLTDNNVPKGAPRPVIATCKKGGEIEVVKGMEKKVQAWLDKGTRGGKVKDGKIVFPDKK